MSEVKTKIDQINTELTRPADSDDSTNWELEKDQWGNKLNKTTFSQVDNNSTLLKEILYYHDQKIDEGTDLDSVKAYILNTMLTDGTTTGIVYQSETGTIEINNEIDRHTSIQGVDFTIREYFKKDAQNKWRHYFKDSNNIENYMLIRDDYTTLNGLISSNTTNITNLTTQISDLISEGIGSGVWKNSTGTSNATEYDEKILHGESVELITELDNPVSILLKSDNVFIQLNSESKIDLSTLTELNFNGDTLDINYVESDNTKTNIFKVGKDGLILPLYGKGNYDHLLNSTPYVLGTNASGDVVEIANTEFNTGGIIPEDTYYYQNLGSNWSNWSIADFEVDQTILDTLGVYSLDKYNALSAGNKNDLLNILKLANITDPTDLEAIKTEINNSSSRIAGVLMKIYTNNIRILMNVEYNMIYSHPLGIETHIATTRVVEVTLSKTPNGTYDSTGSIGITRKNRSNINIDFPYYQYGSGSVGMNAPLIINYKENGAPSNRFGVRLGGGWMSTFDYPQYIGKYPPTSLITGNFYAVSRRELNPPSIILADTTNPNYGDQKLFSARTFRVSHQGNYITYLLSFRYVNNQTTTLRILDKIPSWLCPSNQPPSDGEVTVIFRGSDNSVTYGRLVGGSSDYAGGYIEHSGTRTAGITYVAQFQIHNQLTF